MPVTDWPNPRIDSTWVGVEPRPKACWDTCLLGYCLPLCRCSRTVRRRNFIWFNQLTRSSWSFKLLFFRTLREIPYLWLVTCKLAFHCSLERPEWCLISSPKNQVHVCEVTLQPHEGVLLPESFQLSVTYGEIQVFDKPLNERFGIRQSYLSEWMIYVTYVGRMKN